MFELEPLLKDFEALCGCRLTIHDQTHVLLNNDSTSMFQPIRSSHRQTYPECSRPCRQYCVTHCMNEYNDKIDRTRPRYCINHCSEGHIEVAAPVFRNGRHVLSVFAGLWHLKTSLEVHRRILSLCRLLPVFAEGLLAEAERIRQKIDSGRQTQKERILSFVSENFNRAVSTRELARYLSLSVTHTCHLVTELCGCSFFELLTRERMTHAELFLRHTDYRVREIAFLCGFASVEHFNRIFKRWNRMSPTQFRKRGSKAGL